MYHSSRFGIDPGMDLGSIQVSLGLKFENGDQLAWNPIDRIEAIDRHFMAMDRTKAELVFDLYNTMDRVGKVIDRIKVMDQIFGLDGSDWECQMDRF